ncbi:DUF5677 domain-containing protein [Adhaeribacter terreus]|uniref:DUF5677 domain-containing protein n=1 Tax=Adhaeribacter terreus TaxID=529703 RepID=A0ABW0EDE7_9BACT
MGRFKKIEIKGLFFENFNKLFDDALIEAINSTDLTEKQIIEKLAPEFEGLFSKYEESISNLYAEKQNINLDNFLKVHFKNQKTIAETNKDSFNPFLSYINISVVVYKKIIEQTKRKKIDSTLKINIALYGLVLRRAQQIVDLLLSGFIDAAMIVWRSLYENAIILLVIAIENNNELADKFFQHSIKNSQRKIVSYNNNYQDLKFKPLPITTEKILKEETERLNQKYGKDFLSNEFGWADDLFPGKQKANFKLLEEKVQMNRFRPYYLICCEQIHSNFNAFNNFMSGSKIVLPSLLNQEIDMKSFIDPMQYTVAILHEVNDYILYEFSTEKEFNVNSLFTQKIFNKLQFSFKPS